MPLGSSIHISTNPQGSVTGSRMTGTPAAARLPRQSSADSSTPWSQALSAHTTSMAPTNPPAERRRQEGDLGYNCSGRDPPPWPIAIASDDYHEVLVRRRPPRERAAHHDADPPRLPRVPVTSA